MKSSLEPIAEPAQLPAQPSASTGPACLAGLDADLTIQVVETAFVRQFGGSADELRGRRLYELIHPSTQPLLEHHFLRLASGSHSRFVDRIVGLHDGRVPFSADITGMAVHGWRDTPAYLVAITSVDRAFPAPRRPRPLHPAVSLSRDDAYILEGIARGASNIQLAARLYLSRQGIEYRISRLLRLLKAPNRAALVARAHFLGLLAAGTWPPRVPSRFIEFENDS